jgi:DNA repair protein RadD
MAPILRPYQVDVLERARARIRGGCRRVLIQGATGAGKGTVIAHMLARSAALGKRSVFLVSRRHLIGDMAGRIAACGVRPGVVMRGHPATASPIQLVSRDTLFSRGIQNDWITMPPADLLVCDEAHNYGERYQQIFELYGKAVLIGASATPVFAGGRGMGSVYQAMECTVPTSQLVREGFLAPVRCYAPSRAVKNPGQRKTAVSGNPVYWWQRYGEGRPTALFAAKRDHAYKACESFNSVNIKAEYLDGQTDDDERRRILDRVAAGQTKVVCSISVLTEGVDVPALSCGILLRAAASCVTFLQIAGRLMRPFPGKKDSVLIDHAGAVIRHGFPDEDVEWTLDPDDSVDRRVKERVDNAPRPIVCPHCTCVYRGSAVCPECGAALPQRKKKAAPLKEDLLIEVPREEQAKLDYQARVRAWARCRGVAVASGGKASRAVAMYKREFGRFPEQDGMPDCLRGAEWQRPAALAWPNFVRAARGEAK